MGLEANLAFFPLIKYSQPFSIVLDRTSFYLSSPVGVFKKTDQPIKPKKPRKN
jgi:hypothetical protein